MIEDAENMCRLCFATEDSENDVVLSGIHQYLPFLDSFAGVSPDDQMPQKICSSCECQIESSQLFRKRVKMTESLWVKFKRPKQQSPPDVLFNCHLCNASFDYAELVLHIETDHGTDHISDCRFCGALFEDSSDDQQPESVQLKPGQRTTVKIERETHEDWIQEETVDEFPAEEYCVELEEEQEQEVETEDQTDDIVVSSRPVNPKDILIRTRTVDKNGKKAIRNTCKYCDYSTLNITDITNHAEKHLANPDPVFALVERELLEDGETINSFCTICKFSDSTLSTVTKHVQQSHGDRLESLPTLKRRAVHVIRGGDSGRRSKGEPVAKKRFTLDSKKNATPTVEVDYGTEDLQFGPGPNDRGVWQYFYRDTTRRFAKCIYDGCGRIIACPNSGTSGLRRHVRNIHHIDDLETTREQGLEKTEALIEEQLE